MAALEGARAIGLDIERPYIGVHIRRGSGCTFADIADCLARTSRCWSGRPCTNTTEYANAVRALARQGYWGPRHAVFVASDDQRAVDELSELLGDHFDVYSQRSAVSRDEAANAVARNEIEMHLVADNGTSKRRLAEEATTDALLLAHASAQVPTLSSQLSRLAFELSFAVHGYVVPFVTADWAWCWAAWGHVQPVTRQSMQYTRLPPC